MTPQRSVAPDTSPQKSGARVSLWETNRPLSALLTLRFGFFTLFAFDVWTIGLSHAPRYGVTSFNVTHLSWLDPIAPLPSPASIGALYLAAGALALLVAVGLVGRLGVGLCTCLYGASYFWSQADSYQHHYLLCLCLVILIGAPWRASESRGGLALRALMWQLALIYGWTAVAKLDGSWLSGETLNRTIGSPEVRSAIESNFTWICETLSLNLETREVYHISAWAVMFGEFFAALAFLVPPLRPYAFFIVPWFHIGVEWIGFDIELFSYYMILLNITLLSPSWMWRPLEKLLGAFNTALTPEELRSSETPRAVNEKPEGASGQRRFIRLLITTCGAGVSAWLVSRTLLEGSALGAYITLGVASVSLWWATHPIHVKPLIFTRLGGIILVGVGLSIGVQHVNVPSFRYDYYRMWGGDLKRRGQLERAYEVYGIANQAQTPHEPARFVQAGEIALKLGRADDGIAALTEGCRRRFLALEESALHLTEALEDRREPDNNVSLSKLSPEFTAELRTQFKRASRSALKAHQRLYQVYLKRRDPRASEQRDLLEGVRQLIAQTEQMTR